LIRKDSKHFFVPRPRVETDIDTTHAFHQEQKEKFQDASVDTKVEQTLEELYVQGIGAISIQKPICLIRNDLNAKSVSVHYVENIRKEIDLLKSFQIDKGDSENIFNALVSLVNIVEPPISFENPPRCTTL